jgi:glycosyltransferase involved in cell wall biosynthesis
MNRLLFILRDISSGGEAVIVKKIQHHLRDSGYNITTISFVGKPGDANKNILFLKKLKVLGFFFISPASLIKVKRLSSLSSASFHYIFDLYSLPLFFASYFGKRKTIISFHVNMQIAPPYLKSLYNYLVRVFLINLLILFTNKVIFITKAQRDLYYRKCVFRRIFLEKSTVIPNFIDEKIIIKNKKHVSESCLNILFVGRLIRSKGFHDLLSLAEKIDDPSIRFNIIGNGKLSNKAKNRENINLLGIIPNEEIMNYYDQNHILLLPSYTEVFPMTILEAMARGLIILASDLQGIYEIVKEGRNGYLFSPGDTEKMKENILFFKKNKVKIGQISSNNIRDVRKFTAKKQIGKYIAVCEKTVGGNIGIL